MTSPLPDLRFEIGTPVMCNMGPDGWQLGRVIALRYREDHWPADRVAPYQVALEADHTLIYVPEDDPRYCRAASPEDLNIARRMDALAAPTAGTDGSARDRNDTQLVAADRTEPGSARYRDGRCHGCDCCPPNWSSVELYSEHYRCAARNGLGVTRRAVELGTVHVGDAIQRPGDGAGFMQCPTLVRLPPGLRFSDDGTLGGRIRFDPHRDETYRVEFVAVSTAAWDDPATGLVRLEITFTVDGNRPPAEFDRATFDREQQQARTAAKLAVRDLANVWLEWEHGDRSNRDTCEQMLAELGRLRTLLEQHPRLDGGRWWAQLGGFHMNVHKLLENTLFECELYLGHALTFGDPNVRRMAEQNLEGCYQKRRLEAARFLWIDGLEQMTRGQWASAAQIFSRAAAQKDGWGWAVNYGDIWMAEAATRLIHGATLAAADGDATPWLAGAAHCLLRAEERSKDPGALGPDGHPWAAEIAQALGAYRRLPGDANDRAAWIESFTSRTLYWCAQALGGAPPFPPQPRARRADAADLSRRLRETMRGAAAESLDRG